MSLSAPPLYAHEFGVWNRILSNRTSNLLPYLCEFGVYAELTCQQLVQCWSFHLCACNVLEMQVVRHKSAKKWESERLGVARSPTPTFCSRRGETPIPSYVWLEIISIAPNRCQYKRQNQSRRRWHFIKCRPRKRGGRRQKAAAAANIKSVEFCIDIDRSLVSGLV